MGIQRGASENPKGNPKGIPKDSLENPDRNMNEELKGRVASSHVSTTAVRGASV